MASLRVSCFRPTAPHSWPAPGMTSMNDNLGGPRPSNPKVWDVGRLTGCKNDLHEHFKYSTVGPAFPGYSAVGSIDTVCMSFLIVLCHNCTFIVNKWTAQSDYSRCIVLIPIKTMSSGSFLTEHVDVIFSSKNELKAYLKTDIDLKKKQLAEKKKK